MDETSERQPDWQQRAALVVAKRLGGYPPKLFTIFMTVACLALAFAIGTCWILLFNEGWNYFFGYRQINGLTTSFLVIAFTTVPIAYPLFLMFASMMQIIEQARRDLARTAEEAKEANRMKSAFLASTSHEIRTPLNGIAGIAQLLSRSDLSDAQREHVRLLNEASHSLSRLLGDILDISKVEAGRMSLAPAPTDFRAIIDTNASLWMATATEKGLRLRSEIDEHTPRWLICDGERIRQCIANLTSNAVKFTDQGTIELSTESRTAEDGAIEISVRVSDTGPGIEETEQERVFEAFEQIGATDKRWAGTGLGLAISRNLARMMGGDIVLRSTPGFGSDFIFTFRAEACEAPKRSKSRRLTAPAEGLRLLVTDDNATNRTVAQLLLRSAGQHVEVAEGGEEALKLLDAQPFDMVLLDMNMPTIDGPETLRRIRASDTPWSGVKVIALTADAMPGDRDRYLAMGLDGYAVKPIDLDLLLGEITKVHQSSKRAAA